MDKKTIPNSPMIIRCDWAKSLAISTEYHDQEWGVPIYDDEKLFEFIILEGMQAGLSWNTILKKRIHLREAFDNFDATLIANYNADKIAALLNNPLIIRHRAKINAVVNNAQCYLAIKQQQSFADFLWQVIGDKPIINEWQSMSQVPASTDLSMTMSRLLKQHGFKFVGPTICYAFMQATGMVNDHLVSCYRYSQLI